MSLADLEPRQINEIIAMARWLKKTSKRVLPPTKLPTREMVWQMSFDTPNAANHGPPPQSLRNMSIALLFSKRSTRTRVSAETAARLLGGQAIFLGKDDIQLGVNENARDTARVLSGMCQGIFARVGEHSEIEELAKYAEVPVINALSAYWHPTQVLADLQTLYGEKSLQEEPIRASKLAPPPPAPEDPGQSPTTMTPTQPLMGNAKSNAIDTAAAQYHIPRNHGRIRNLTVAYVGDSANVLHDMLVTYPRLGHKLQVASPPNPRYRAPPPVWDKVVELGCDKSITWTEDPREAVQGADVVVTDTWISMGQEAEYEQRVKDFQGYQVTEKLCEGAKRDWKFLHCLPRKSHEVDDEVFYSPRSLVFREADNRTWTIMALFHMMFGGGNYESLPPSRRQLYTSDQQRRPSKFSSANKSKGKNQSSRPRNQSKQEQPPKTDGEVEKSDGSSTHSMKDAADGSMI
ncbi:ornithine carbamoyltransferase [Fomitiporia mediterranea MF3/22]|uniref:ornithine carbamoyltransferase n=1 Tax=Fomitiporia mediterranea (strain MF3/22) TaxID=694068 RepID=UPI0004407570|nr:ornithine carbamoyltransferase [Fomitiporia mediterranea MF3/22]EJD00549.1 ornithine carbamoyltransferase [Fomitiporia mediterranea MF3/22]